MAYIMVTDLRTSLLLCVLVSLFVSTNPCFSSRNPLKHYSSTSELILTPPRASLKDPNFTQNGFHIKCRSKKIQWKILTELAVETYDEDAGQYIAIAISADRFYRIYRREVLWSNPYYITPGHIQIDLYKPNNDGAKRELNMRVMSLDPRYYVTYRCSAYGIDEDGNSRKDYSPRKWYYIHND